LFIAGLYYNGLPLPDNGLPLLIPLPDTFIAAIDLPFSLIRNLIAVGVLTMSGKESSS